MSFFLKEKLKWTTNKVKALRTYFSIKAEEAWKQNFQEKNRKDTKTYRELEFSKIITTRESNSNQNSTGISACLYFDTSPNLSRGYKGDK